MNHLSLGRRGKQAFITGAAGVLLGLPINAGDAPPPLPVAPVSSTTPAAPVAGQAAPNFQSQQYNNEVQRQLDLLYQPDPQTGGQPNLPKPPAGPPQPKKMRMKDWVNPAAWKRYNRSRQRLKEYEERQRQAAETATETDLGKPANLTLGGTAPLAPAVTFAPEVATPRSVTPPAAPPAIPAAPPAQAAPPAVFATAPQMAAARPQLRRVSPEIFQIPSTSAAEQPPVFDFGQATSTPAPAQGQPRLLPAPGSMDASETQTPTLTILPTPSAAGNVALHAAPPAEMVEEFENTSQESSGFLDEPAVSVSDLPVADDSAAALFGAPIEEPAAESNPFESESTGPYTGLELQDNPFAAPEPLPAPGSEAAVTPEPPTFAAEEDVPISEPVAALLAPPPEESTDAPSPIPTRLAMESTALAVPAPLPATTTPTRTAAKTVSASAAPTDVQQKLTRISERRGLTGFKGFCPVMLRDYRELVDAKLEHTVQHAGRQYWFSSAAAQETFQQNPAAYLPARGGIDVVIFDEIGEQKDGSLDNAVWYRGQLYLFSSSETQAAFAAQPQLHQVE